MQKKAIILDLDNTIYPVSSIGDKLFYSLFELIEKSGAYQGNLEEIKNRIMRQPFQVVANDFSFSEDLKEKCLQLLSDLTYDEKMEPFAGYEIVRTIPCKKYLVTTGFTKLQHSKIRQLNIEKEFEGIFVVDPSKTEQTKKDIFKQILTDNHYNPGEVLVIGDDLHSEIKAAKELGINTILYNHAGEQPKVKDQATIHSFEELADYLA